MGRYDTNSVYYEMMKMLTDYLHLDFISIPCSLSNVRAKIRCNHLVLHMFIILYLLYVRCTKINVFCLL